MRSFYLLKLHTKAVSILELIQKANRKKSFAEGYLKKAESYNEPQDWHKAPAWIVIKGKAAAMREQRQEIAKYDAIIERLERYYKSIFHKIWNQCHWD